MDLFDKFEALHAIRQALPLQDADPFSVCMDEVLSPTEAVIDGRRTVLAGTNNYLGLTFDPRALAAAHEALDAAGTGTTGSRMANGTYGTHVQLEDKLKEFYGTDHAMVFSTGYLANLGIISTLAGKDDIILIDGDCHASIYDACSLGQATIVRFRHNSAEDLDKRLTRLNADGGRVLIIAEGLYSMLGDVAPLKAIVDVKKKHNAYLLLDEAHSLGVYGESGRGIAQDLDIANDVDFIVGTFSKSVGTIGGFCVSNHPKFPLLRVACRPYIFTASLPPSVVASACANLDVIMETPELREKLWANAQRLYDGFQREGFDLGADCSPVIAVKVDSPNKAAMYWEALLKSGVYVNLAMPPATPSGLCLLRCSVSAAHTPEQIDFIVEKFAAVMNSNKIAAEG